MEASCCLLANTPIDPIVSNLGPIIDDKFRRKNGLLTKQNIVHSDVSDDALMGQVYDVVSSSVEH